MPDNWIGRVLISRESKIFDENRQQIHSLISTDKAGTLSPAVFPVLIGKIGADKPVLPALEGAAQYKIIGDPVPEVNENHQMGLGTWELKLRDPQPLTFTTVQYQNLSGDEMSGGLGTWELKLRAPQPLTFTTTQYQNMAGNELQGGLGTWELQVRPTPLILTTTET